MKTLGGILLAMFISYYFLGSLCAGGTWFLWCVFREERKWRAVCRRELVT
jgi:hypothetical protein